jgi:hypothetical protein
MVVKRFGKVADAMLNAVPPEYRLEDTGFTKVTLAMNNPTPVSP